MPKRCSSFPTMVFVSFSMAERFFLFPRTLALSHAHTAQQLRLGLWHVDACVTSSSPVLINLQHSIPQVLR